MGTKEKKQIQHSVRQRIVVSHALMILVTIAVCGVIGAICVKIYWEREERALESLIGSQIAGNAAEEFIEGLTVHNDLFILMALLFAALCIIAFIVISRLFAAHLTKEIMEPLNLLEQGAERIRNNDYSTPVVYNKDLEFAHVCDAFNAMQEHLVEEKEKNAKYEKARQDMIAGISHDLRSPLTAIRGAVKAILDGIVKEPDQQKKFLETAYRRSGEMDQLLNELFYFSKLETGGIPVQVQSLDLSSYLTAFVNAQREMPENEHTEFVFEPVEGLPAAQADPEALQRILSNIIGNSRKYAEVTPLRILVKLTEVDGKQALTIQDNGAGVPKEELPHLFEEFYRVDKARNGRKKGSGLGLYIVKYLCDAMGGSVSCDVDSHAPGFAGLAVTLTFREGDANGEQADHSDR